MACLDLAGGVGLLEPVADDRPAVEVAHGRRELVAEVAGLLHRRRRHQQHDGREEDHHAAAHDPRGRDAAIGRSARCTSAASGDSATPEHDADRDARDHVGRDRDDRPDRGGEGGRRGEHHHRRRVDVDELHRGRGVPHPPRTARSPLGTVRRDAQPDGDRGAAVVPPHRRRRRSRSSAPSSGWSSLKRVFVAAHRPLSWAVAAVAAAVLLDPIVDRLAVHIRRVPGGAAHLPRHRRRRGRHHLPGVRRGRAGRRPPGGRGPEGGRRPSRTATTGSASWLATSSSASASTDARRRARRAGHRRRGRAALHRRHGARLPRVRDPHDLPHDLRTAHGARRPRAGSGRASDGRAPPRVSARRCADARTAVLLSDRWRRSWSGWWWRRWRPPLDLPAPSAVGFTAGVLSPVPPRRPHARVHPAAPPRPRLPIADAWSCCSCSWCWRPSSPTRSCSARTRPAERGHRPRRPVGGRAARATAIYGIGGAVFGVGVRRVRPRRPRQLERENRRRASSPL